MDLKKMKALFEVSKTAKKKKLRRKHMRELKSLHMSKTDSLTKL